MNMKMVSVAKKPSQIIFLATKVFLFGICFILFILLMEDVWRKYQVIQWVPLNGNNPYISPSKNLGGRGLRKILGGQKIS
jgi:hypothetical protein